MPASVPLLTNRTISITPPGKARMIISASCPPSRSMHEAEPIRRGTLHGLNDRGMRVTCDGRTP